jgi:hypothetical protein
VKFAVSLGWTSPFTQTPAKEATDDSEHALVRARAFADFKHRIRKLTGRSFGVSMEARIRRLREYLQGWMGYFGITELLPTDPRA